MIWDSQPIQGGAMSHCTRAMQDNILTYVQVKAKDALHSLTKERDGIDGSSIYMYVQNHKLIYLLLGFIITALELVLGFSL